MKSKRTIIIETAIEYHTDPKRRATQKVGSCQYVTQDGRRCAVGRCTTLDLDVKGIHTAMAYLKPEYKEHDIHFWLELQRFHDNDINWDAKGMSPHGVMKFKCMLSACPNK